MCVVHHQENKTDCSSSSTFHYYYIPLVIHYFYYVSKLDGVLSYESVAFIGGSLFILQQFAGINGVLYFSSLTFQDVGITSSSLASLLVGLTNFAGYKYCYSHLGFCRFLFDRNLIIIHTL